MLVEGGPQGPVPWAFEFTRGQMRATRAENPGHHRGQHWETLHGIYQFGDARRKGREFSKCPLYFEKIPLFE